MRGLAIDPQDNVWFSNYNGHKIGKLDAKTGTIKEYQPPTKNAAPTACSWIRPDMFGILDLVGNNLTRFDPKTEQFVEYPLPTRDAGPKFSGHMEREGGVWFTEVMGSKIGGGLIQATASRSLRLAGKPVFWIEISERPALRF